MRWRDPFQTIRGLLLAGFVALSVMIVVAGLLGGWSMVSTSQVIRNTLDSVQEETRLASQFGSSIAQEVAPYRIRVNSICPGAIRTPINMEAWGTPEAYSELLKLIPYKRIGEADEIGRAAVWLASDYADYVHGISLFVDGGMTLYPGFETGG